MDDPSVLLSHEAAFALGQMGSRLACGDLLRVLRDEGYHPIVRHEVREGGRERGSDERQSGPPGGMPQNER